VQSSHIPGPASFDRIRLTTTSDKAGKWGGRRPAQDHVGQTSYCVAGLPIRSRLETLENVMTVLSGILNPGRGSDAMRLSEARALVQLHRPEPDPAERTLRRCVTIEDLQHAAWRR
jgi:hypothetical protein